MAIRVSHKIDLPRVHWDETEFSLVPPLAVVVPLPINKNIAIAASKRLFLSRGVLKLCPKSNMFDLQQRWYGIENLDKDGSLHEQMYYIWWEFIIRVNTRANIIWQSDFG